MCRLRSFSGCVCYLQAFPISRPRRPRSSGLGCRSAASGPPYTSPWRRRRPRWWTSSCNAPASDAGWVPPTPGKRRAPCARLSRHAPDRGSLARHRREPTGSACRPCAGARVYGRLRRSKGQPRNGFDHGKIRLENGGPDGPRPASRIRLAGASAGPARRIDPAPLRAREAARSPLRRRSRVRGRGDALEFAVAGQGFGDLHVQRLALLLEGGLQPQLGEQFGVALADVAGLLVGDLLPGQFAVAKRRAYPCGGAAVSVGAAMPLSSR